MEEKAQSSGLHIPDFWQEIEPADMAGTILVIGATDSGKSTFVRWMMTVLSRCHRRVAWLDGDIGQSSLGVPTTMNLAVFESSLENPPVLHKTFFVGNTSPRGHMLPTVIGMFRLQQRALAEAAGVVLVDTTGFIEENAGGGALKQWKIELLKPREIIAFQRGKNLAHILPPHQKAGECRIRQFHPVPEAQIRTLEARAGRREELFRRYFRSAGKLTVSLEQMPVFGPTAIRRKTVIAFQDPDGFALALGVLMAQTDTDMTVLTPLPSLGRVASLRVGSIRIDPYSGEALE